VIGHATVGNLAAGQHEAQWASLAIAQSVDLRGAAAA
jgi:hypothetical protein